MFVSTIVAITVIIILDVFVAILATYHHITHTLLNVNVEISTFGGRSQGLPGVEIFLPLQKVELFYPR